MTDSPRFRVEVRQQLREGILDAARHLTVAHGWAGVRMEDVAAAAGVSRRTVYNEFTGRDGLAEAVVDREIGVFLVGVRDVLESHGSDLRAAARAAINFVLTEAADNPLVKSVLTSARGGEDSMLPFLTTNAEHVLASAIAVMESYVAHHFPDVPLERVAVGAEILARVVVSNVVLPLAPTDTVAEELADMVVRYVESIGAQA